MPAPFMPAFPIRPSCNLARMTTRRFHGTRRRSAQEIEELVYNILVAANMPLGAYAIAARAGPTLVPNQVYRTLSRLIVQGRVRRIEALSAYISCFNGTDACLICDDCHGVHMLAMPELRSQLTLLANAAGFAFEQAMVEIHGHCPECSGAAPEPARNASMNWTRQSHDGIAG